MGEMNFRGKKTLLVLSGGVEAVEGIRIAKQMGLDVVVCDINPRAPGRALADWFICADIYNPVDVASKVLRFAKKRRIDGVITIASDAVRAVAEVAELLRLPGISRSTAFVTTDKFIMKKVLAQKGVPVPGFASVGSVDEIREKIRAFERAVIKPVDSRGARGVIRVTPQEDLEEAFSRAIRHSPSKRLIIEEWLDGAQISAEALVIRGRVYLCGIADRNYSRLKETYPYVIEDGGETPSRFSPRIDESIREVLQDTADAIEIEDGVIKADIVLREGSPVIIEVASRLSGGFFSTITIPLVYGINITGMAILLALGLKVTPPDKLRPVCYQANRFIFTGPGTVTKIIAPEVEELPDYVKHLNIGVKEGDQLEEITDHTKRRGSVLVCADSRKEAIERAELLIRKIRIEVDTAKTQTRMCRM